MRKVYRVTRRYEHWYDEFDSFIVVALDEEEAKKLAQEAADEVEYSHSDKRAFLDGTAEVEPVGGKSRVLLGSFNAG